MVVELTSRTRVLFWSGIVLVSMSIGILGYAVSRYTFLSKCDILSFHSTCEFLFNIDRAS